MIITYLGFDFMFLQKRVILTPIIISIPQITEPIDALTSESVAGDKNAATCFESCISNTINKIEVFMMLFFCFNF